MVIIFYKFVLFIGLSCISSLASHSSFRLQCADDADCRMEDVILSFLLIRQIGFESSSFSYEKWFSDSFGNMTTSKAKSKRGYGLLVKFLTSLVPFEPASFLKVLCNCVWKWWEILLGLIS